jgi:hypothetical protein
MPNSGAYDGTAPASPRAGVSFRHRDASVASCCPESDHDDVVLPGDFLEHGRFHAQIRHSPMPRFVPRLQGSSAPERSTDASLSGLPQIRIDRELSGAFRSAKVCVLSRSEK